MKARDYPERARDAVKEMHRQVGDLVLDANGLAKVFESPIIRIKDLELICEKWLRDHTTYTESFRQIMLSNFHIGSQ